MLPIHIGGRQNCTGGDELRAFVGRAIDLMQAHPKSRLSTPWMKMMDHVLQNGLLDELCDVAADGFTPRLLAVTKAEVTGSRDVLKIKAAVDMYVLTPHAPPNSHTGPVCLEAALILQARHTYWSICRRKHTDTQTHRHTYHTTYTHTHSAHMHIHTHT